MAEVATAAEAQQAQPHHLTLAMGTVLSAALPQEARGATHQLLTMVHPTGTESGRPEGLKQLHVEAIAVTPRCHRPGEADVVEAEAELHVKREARAVGMPGQWQQHRQRQGRWQGGGTGEGYPGPGPASLGLARLRRLFIRL